VTPAEVQALAQRIVDRVECRILRNLIGMHQDAVPPDQIAAYLELEREQLTHWLEHDLEDQVRAWVASWPAA